MPEPIDPVLKVPVGGWPRARVRLDLDDDLAPELAFYEVAGASRRWRCGVVVGFRGVDLFAFPHQSVDEIARTWLRLRREGPR